MNDFWSYHPPTKAGYYYVEDENEKERIAKLNNYGVWSIDGYHVDLVSLGYTFGMEVPDSRDFQDLLYIEFEKYGCYRERD